MSNTLKDSLQIIGFVALVIFGAIFINAFLFRTFAVTGPSMEPTFYTGDRVLVNRLHHTASLFTGRSYIPERGTIIVFENPIFVSGQPDKYVVKRVIGLPGERVEVSEGRIMVFNSEFPNGFSPDMTIDGPRFPTSGETSVVVPENEIFVAGDNRIDNFSLDSRNGLGTVPLENIIGPLKAQIFPFNSLRLF